MRGIVSWGKYALTNSVVTIDGHKQASLDLYRKASLVLVAVSVLTAAFLAVIAGVHIKLDGAPTLAGSLLHCWSSPAFSGQVSDIHV